ncbi:60 kDa lysophospholipase [Rhynchocyon petersi]
MARATGPERRLLAVYTGGTIGMRSEGGGLAPGLGLASVLRKLPMFHDEDYARACQLPEDTLVLPPASLDQRVIYTVLEWQPLLDSRDMTIEEWVKIAQTIEKHYEQHHGFVVIHGTDTMAFAASTLSFVLENLRKPVILTGAQVPIHALWNDGRENLLGALLMAGQYLIPEVCLFFQNQLFRGNRATKVDSRRFAAFCSPNLPPLATVGADITINRRLVRKVWGKAPLVVHSCMERDVGVLRLYPGIPASLVRAFLQPPLKGVVLETFGSGNGPTKPELLQELRAAAGRGLLILNCTHCLQGTVTSDYATGKALAGTGLLSGFDMTSEAALAKLAYVLGQPGLSLDDRKQLLAKDLRGEMTLPAAEHQPSLCGSSLGSLISQFLSLSDCQELDAVRDVLLPSLACAAAHAGDLEVLQALLDAGSDLAVEDFSGQTPLHVAARRGHARAVSLLLQRGADVQACDGDGVSPLLLAIRGRHRDVIGLLRAAGACLSPRELDDVGTELCRLASKGDVEGLQTWWQAGADLRQPGYDGRQALHIAESAGNVEMLTLLQHLVGTPWAGSQAAGLAGGQVLSQAPPSTALALHSEPQAVRAPGVPVPHMAASSPGGYRLAIVETPMWSLPLASLGVWLFPQASLSLMFPHWSPYYFLQQVGTRSQEWSSYPLMLEKLPPHPTPPPTPGSLAPGHTHRARQTRRSLASRRALPHPNLSSPPQQAALLAAHFPGAGVAGDARTAHVKTLTNACGPVAHLLPGRAVGPSETTLPPPSPAAPWARHWVGWGLPRSIVSRSACAPPPVSSRAGPRTVPGGGAALGLAVGGGWGRRRTRNLPGGSRPPGFTFSSRRSRPLKVPFEVRGSLGVSAAGAPRRRSHPCPAGPGGSRAGAQARTQVAGGAGGRGAVSQAAPAGRERVPGRPARSRQPGPTGRACGAGGGSARIKGAGAGSRAAGTRRVPWAPALLGARPAPPPEAPADGALGAVVLNSSTVL